MKTKNYKKLSGIGTSLVILFVLTSIMDGFSQIVPVTAFAESKYGFSITEMRMKNGQGKAYIPYFTVEKGRRALELGVILQDSEEVLTGFTSAFKFMLGKTDESGIFSSCSKFFNPYLFYNFNYFSKHYSTVTNPALSGLYEIYGSRIRVASHEHYLGIGMKLNISQRMCLDLGYGAGTYLGSIENLKNSEDMDNLPARSGLTSMYKISLGFKVF